MAFQKHNKLVRDLIPDELRQRGIACHVVQLDEASFQAALKNKLQEEVTEFLNNPCEEELADIIEVVEALRQLYPLVEHARRIKRDLRGGFTGRLFLVSTDE